SAFRSAGAVCSAALAYLSPASVKRLPSKARLASASSRAASWASSPVPPASTRKRVATSACDLSGARQDAGRGLAVSISACLLPAPRRSRGQDRHLHATASLDGLRRGAETGSLRQELL